ncbi:MAG: hypothetical protein LBU23_01025 [Planctomycetota bacterium]|jgi:hypothetical protein|nr:hypothetical protein [Planctomycetota bacterium]
MFNLAIPAKRRRCALEGGFAAVFLLFGMTPAPALDANDVRSLLQNRVPEETILNLVRADGTIYITNEEADGFRALGASENLVAALRPRATVLPPAPGPAAADSGQPVVPLGITLIGAHPPRRDKDGWLSISNYDSTTYYLMVSESEKRIFVSRNPNGGLAVGPGRNEIINLRKHDYKLYGDSGRDLKVKIRKGETTSLSLNPFGVVGNSGIIGVAVDREKTRSETLFDVYSPPPPVIIQEAPAIIVQEPPPVYAVPVYPGPYFRHPRGGGGFHFRYRR